jgi:hypothetical protein
MLTSQGTLLALALTTATVLAAGLACGGGDDTGSDGDYVVAFCDARRQFSSDLDAAVKQVSAAGGGEFDRIADTFTELADDFDEMKPPEDLKDWHENASKQLSETASKIKKEKNLQAVTSLQRDPLSGMPEEPRERLKKEAENQESCKGLNAFEG